MSNELTRLRDENDVLKKKMKEYEDFGCHIADETGYKCHYITENERLKGHLKFCLMLAEMEYKKDFRLAAGEYCGILNDIRRYLKEEASHE